jgi:hypothetical protein
VCGRDNGTPGYHPSLGCTRPPSLPDFPSGPCPSADSMHYHLLSLRAVGGQQGPYFLLRRRASLDAWGPVRHPPPSAAASLICRPRSAICSLGPSVSHRSTLPPTDDHRIESSHVTQFVSLPPILASLESSETHPFGTSRTRPNANIAPRSALPVHPRRPCTPVRSRDEFAAYQAIVGDPEERREKLREWYRGCIVTGARSQTIGTYRTIRAASNVRFLGGSSLRILRCFIEEDIAPRIQCHLQVVS